jgi:hypothetical protein
MTHGFLMPSHAELYRAPQWIIQPGTLATGIRMSYFSLAQRVSEAMEQAFVLGYLCHVATDEVTGQLAGYIYQQLFSSGKPMPGADAVLTAVDPRLWGMALDPDAMLMALDQISIPGETLPFAPAECLQALYRVVLPQVREGGGLEPYLRTVQRHRQFMRRGSVTGAIDADLEAELATLRRELERDLPLAERLVDGLDLQLFVRDAVERSCQRIASLLAEENVQ